jgi:two-component system, LytTR family, response regulator
MSCAQKLRGAGVKIRALIVDDEPLARERMRMALAGEPDVEIAGECATGLEALAFIQNHRPNLLLLDVLMPGMSGFEVLCALPPEQVPATILVTAYDQHAVKAFEVRAVDYLLKPVKASRFRQALDRARQVLNPRNAAAASQNESVPPHEPTLPAFPSRLSVKAGDKTFFLEAAELDYITCGRPLST